MRGTQWFWRCPRGSSWSTSGLARVLMLAAGAMPVRSAAAPARLLRYRRALGPLTSVSMALIALGRSAPTGPLAAMGVSAIQSIEGQRQGIAGPISWWAGDMQLITKENAYGAYDLYVFTLVLKNTGDVPATFTRQEWNVMDQDVIRSAPSAQAASWLIAPQGERRSTWPYSLVCPPVYTCAPTQIVEPTWTFRFTGSTAQDQRVDVPISVTLPAQTLRTRFQW